MARSEGLTYVLSGGLTYRQHLLMKDDVDGMTEKPAVSLASQRAMKEFAQAEPAVLLPAHDPEAAIFTPGSLPAARASRTRSASAS